MHIVELTLNDGRKRLVNLDRLNWMQVQICAVHPEGSRTYLRFHGEDGFEVKETPEEILTATPVAIWRRQ